MSDKIRGSTIHRLILVDITYSVVAIAHERILTSTAVIIEHAQGIVFSIIHESL